jgi:hypothetical protein
MWPPSLAVAAIHSQVKHLAERDDLAQVDALRQGPLEALGPNLYDFRHGLPCTDKGERLVWQPDSVCFLSTSFARVAVQRCPPSPHSTRTPSGASALFRWA